MYSLFGYASEETNGGSSGGGANLKLEKESKLLLDEKHIEHTLLKNHGVIKKTLPEVSPTDFEKYLKAIRTSYARFVATSDGKEEEFGRRRRNGVEVVVRVGVDRLRW